MQRQAGQVVARSLLLLTVLGLMAMHGLPDAMASPGSIAVMDAAGMPTHSTTPSSPRAPLSTVRRRTHAQLVSLASSPVDNRALYARRGAAFSPRDGAVPMGCAMDHAGCLAVLRDAGPLTAAGPVAVVAVLAGMPQPSPMSTPASGPRAPPDVSLIGLGISRT